MMQQEVLSVSGGSFQAKRHDGGLAVMGVDAFPHQLLVLFHKSA